MIVRLGGGGGGGRSRSRESLSLVYIPLLSLQFVLKNYGENPEAYNEELKKLELLRQVGG